MSSATPAAGGDPSVSGPLATPVAREILERARGLSASGDYQAAASLFARLIGHREPIVHVAALLGLADARYRLDDEEGALQAWITATQAPETPISWQPWVAIAGARVRQGDLSGAARAYREAERRAPAHEQPLIASRLGSLNRELANSDLAGRHFAGRQFAGREFAGRGLASPRSGTLLTPLATWAILVLTVGVSGATLLSQGAAELLFGLFQLDKEAVRAGEWWRLITVALVHGNLVHLFFNMYALYIVGPIVELLYGPVRFAAFYVASAAAGSVASYLVLEDPSVGASGAVFGMFGLIMVSIWVHRPALGGQPRALAGQIAVLIVINLAIGFGIDGGFMGGRIDNAAHIGGLVAGAWLGLTVAPRIRSIARGMPSNPWLGVAAVLVVVAVIAAGLSIQPLWA